jgi:amino acid transporter
MSTHRTLGFWDVFCIAAGAMISSGLFVLPGIAFGRAGPGMILSYAMAGFLVIPAVFSQAELTSAMPRSGGTYVFIEKSLGTFPGTFAGLASWFSLAFKSAFALVGIGAFARLIWPDSPDWVMKAVAVAFCVVFAALNILTVRGVGRAQIAMVVLLLAILLTFVFGGIATGKMNHASFEGFMDKGWAILATSGMVFISFGGLTEIANISGEIRNPGRAVPMGMFLALGVVSLLYVAAVFVTVGVSPADQLTGHLTPLSLAASQFFGTAGTVILAAAAMLAFVTTANGGILEASRSPMAMSRDGLLPGALGRSSRFGTPAVSIAITSVFMILVITVLTLENLVKVASTMILTLYMLVNLAVLTMRRSRLQNYRPLFRTPAFPWIQLAGVAIYVLLIVEMGWVPVLTTACFAAAGIVWWALYVRPRVSRESALVYMVRQLLTREMYRSDLEDELKEIALERDEVRHDFFDRLVSRCAILDIPAAIDQDELFRLAGESLAGPVNRPADEVTRLLAEREAQSTTVIQPGLAIPHIIVPGEGTFELLLVRCVEGIDFEQKDEPVRVAFVLAASPDQRDLHLRALMAIAHIVQEHAFTERWLKAPTPENLRDIILLSGRQRHQG